MALNMNTKRFKTELTLNDHARLDAARGLDLHADIPGYRTNANKLGLRPSVEDYNRAIKRGIYIGQPIAPLGTPVEDESDYEES